MGKHLTYEKRLVIDRMLVKKHSVKEIADALGCHRSTIYREIKRVERWMNSYPRRQFGGRSSGELFDMELKRMV